MSVQTVKAPPKNYKYCCSNKTNFLSDFICKFQLAFDIENRVQCKLVFYFKKSNEIFVDFHINI